MSFPFLCFLSLKNLIDNLTNTVNVNTNLINSLNSLVSISLTDRYTKLESDNRYYTKSEINDKIINYIYQTNTGLFTVLNIKHNFGINLSILNEILLSIEASTGISINTSAHIENN